MTRTELVMAIAHKLGDDDHEYPFSDHPHGWIELAEKIVIMCNEQFQQEMAASCIMSVTGDDVMMIYRTKRPEILKP